MRKVFESSVEIANLLIAQSLNEIENYNEKYLTNKSVKYQLVGVKQNFSIIFSSSRGVFVIDTNKKVCRQILKGKFYGITKYYDFFFFARLGSNGEKNFPKNERVSEIYYSKISNYKIVNLKIALFGIPAELHQIENLTGNLIFPHTGFNQVLSIPFDDILNSKQFLKITDCNSIEFNLNEFSHLNSIFYKNRKLYLVAHNYTMKTGKLSDLVIYDIETKHQEIINLNAHSAHNVYVNEYNEIIYCDSNNKKLIKNDKVVFEGDKLLRGLSVTQDRIFVGGSDICFDDFKRFSSNSSIYILNNHGELQTELVFDEIGDIYEIRQLEENELSVIQKRL